MSNAVESYVERTGGAFTRASVRALAAEIESALAPIAERHGIQIKTGSATYLGRNAVIKVECSGIDEHGEAETREALRFVSLAGSFGIAPHVRLRATFAAQGATFTIVGLATRGTRFPVLARREDGKTFKFAVASVNRLVKP